MAMMYVLWKNFEKMGNRTGMRYTLFFGTIITFAFCLILPFVPNGFPNYLFPVLYAVAAKFTAAKFQLSKQAILQSDKYEFQTGWNVLAITFAFFAASVALIFAWFIVAAQLGLVALK